MSLRSKRHELGKVLVSHYTFERAGDRLPLHSHGPAQEHFTIVAAGTIRVIVPGQEDQVWKAPTIGHPSLQHEFEAMEDETVVFNIQMVPLP